MERLEALRRLLTEGDQSTQDELREKLERQAYKVTQSTISRDLRKLGAIKAIDRNGRTVYRLNQESILVPVGPTSLRDLILDIKSNEAMIVLHTPPGSASLIARHLDQMRPAGMLGTIAGDDTIFVAPRSSSAIPETMKAIRDSFGEES